MVPARWYFTAFKSRDHSRFSSASGEEHLTDRRDVARGSLAVAAVRVNGRGTSATSTALGRQRAAPMKIRRRPDIVDARSRRRITRSGVSR